MTKRELYLFNPDNDLSLASGEVNYMPPATARRMAEELALLPAWYASAGSAVLAPSAYNLAFLREMQECLSLPVELVTEPEVASISNLKPVPWGWNPALKRRLRCLGMPETELPAEPYLEKLRHLSHRSQAVELLPRLQLDESFCGESFYLTQPEESCRFVESRASCLLKAPLSGSGKGLNWCKGAYTAFIAGWCKRVAALQGGVIAEPVYNKVIDFAMEFFSDGVGKVVFVGYSIFSTNASGAYDGNLLLPDEEIERRLSAYVPKVSFDRLKRKLEEELSSRFGSVYSGYLGVDMMVCRSDKENGYRVHPCVEINMRMNMGVVARLFYDRFVALGSKGCFAVEYVPDNETLRARHEQDMHDYPSTVEQGRLASGYLPLVPVTGKSCYRAYVRI